MIPTSKHSLSIIGLIIIFFTVFKIISINSLILDKVDIRPSLENKWNTKIFNNLFAPPDKQRHFCLQINKGKKRNIEFNLNPPIYIGGVSMFFSGNWIRISSFSPKTITVLFYDLNNQPHLIGKTKNNYGHVYKKNASTNIFTQKISIILEMPHQGETAQKKIVCIQDLQFYSIKKTTLSGIVQNFTKGDQQGVSRYWIAYFILFLYLFIPGYGLLSIIEDKKNLSIETSYKIIFSPFISILLLSLTTILYLMSGSKIIFLLFPGIWLLASIYLLIKKKFKPLLKKPWAFISIFLPLLIIFLVVARRDYIFNLPHIGLYLDSQKPIPINRHLGYQSDNLMPWKIARVYLNRLPLNDPQAKNLLTDTTVYERTPILPLSVASMASLFGESHFFYQRFLEILAALSYGTFYILFKKIFSTRHAKIILLLTLINAPYSLMSFNTELYYKYFSIYPIILFLIYFFQSKKTNSFISAILLSTGFLIHPGTLMIIIPIGLIYLLKYKFSFNLIKQLSPSAILISLLLIFWVLTPKILHSQNENNKQPTTYYFNELQKLDTHLIQTKAQNLLALFIPNPSILGENSKPISIFSSEFQNEFFRFSIIANVTPFLFIYALIRGIPKKKKDQYVLFLGILPLIVYWLIYLNQKNQLYNFGGGYFLLFPFSVPFLLAYIVNLLHQLTLPIRIILISSYVIFMSFSLYKLSDMFQNIYYTEITISIITASTLLMYALLSIMLILETVKLSSPSKSNRITSLI